MFFSIIIPVFNRPDEIRELLASICAQDFRDFEVIVIEDGSTIKADLVCKAFEVLIPIRYFFQPNSGQGFARNFGMKRASGEFFIILDSDVILPKEYLTTVFQALTFRK